MIPGVRNKTDIELLQQSEHKGHPSSLSYLTMQDTETREISGDVHNTTGPKDMDIHKTSATTSPIALPLLLF